MFQQIFVPLDGSAAAEHALPVAACLARGCGGKLVFVRLVSSPVICTFNRIEEAMVAQLDPLAWQRIEAEQYLDRVTNRYANELRKVPFEQAIDTTSASSSLLSMACQKQNDLIVLCSHQAHGLFHWTWSGLIHEAHHHRPVPLLWLNETARASCKLFQERPTRILVPLDGSPLSEEVLQPVLHLMSGLAITGPGEIHLLQVMERPGDAGATGDRVSETRRGLDEVRQRAEISLQRVAHQLSEQLPKTTGSAITWSVRSSLDVAETILGVAERAKSDQSHTIIAMTTHGQNGLQRLMPGHVTEHILSATRLPLFLVPPPQIQYQHNQPAEMLAHVELHPVSR